MSGGFLPVLCFHGATVEPTEHRGRKRSALHAHCLNLGSQGIGEKCGQNRDELGKTAGS